MFWWTVPLRGQRVFYWFKMNNWWSMSKNASFINTETKFPFMIQNNRSDSHLCFASINKLCSVSSVHRAEEIRPSQEAWRLGPIDMHSSAPPLASEAPSICQSASDSLQTDMSQISVTEITKRFYQKQTSLSYFKKKCFDDKIRNGQYFFSFFILNFSSQWKTVSATWRICSNVTSDWHTLFL